MTEEKKRAHRDLSPGVEGKGIVPLLLAAEKRNQRVENVESEVRLLRQLIKLHVDHIATFRFKQPMSACYMTKRNAAQIFLRNYDRERWILPVKNWSPNDLLFVAACYAEVCSLKPDELQQLKPADDNLQQLTADLFELGRFWHNLSINAPPDTARMLFRRCAVWVVCVFGRSDGIARAVELCDHRMLAADGSHPGLSDAGRIRKPVESSERKKIERDAQLVRDEKEAERHQQVSLITSNFVPLCARIFLHIWADDCMMKSAPRRSDLFDEKAASEKRDAAIAAARAKAETEAAAPHERKGETTDADDAAAMARGGPIHAWMYAATRGTHHISAELSAMWATMPYRENLALGAAHFAKRRPGSAKVKVPPFELYKLEASEEQLAALQKLAKTPIPDIAADPEHALYNALLLTFYGFRFQIEFPDVKFFETLFVMADEVPARQTLINSSKTPERKDRPPVGVQMMGEYFLHHKGVWTPFGRHLEQLLLCQLRLMIEQDKGRLPTGESLVESWSKQFE